MKGIFEMMKRIVVFAWCFVFACSPKETVTKDTNSFFDSPFGRETNLFQFTLRSDGEDNTWKVFDISRNNVLSLDFVGYPEPSSVVYSWRDEYDREISRNSFLHKDEVLGLRSVSVYATIYEKNGSELSKSFKDITIEPYQTKISLKVIDEREQILVMSLYDTTLRQMNIEAEDFVREDYEMMNACVEPEFTGEMMSPYPLMMGEEEFDVVEEEVINPYGQVLNYEWYLNGEIVPDVMTYRFPKSLLKNGDVLKVLVFSENVLPIEMVIEWNQSSSDS